MGQESVKIGFPSLGQCSVCSFQSVSPPALLWAGPGNLWHSDRAEASGFPHARAVYGPGWHSGRVDSSLLYWSELCLTKHGAPLGCVTCWDHAPECAGPSHRPEVRAGWAVLQAPQYGGRAARASFLRHQVWARDAEDLEDQGRRFLFTVKMW